MKTAEHVVARFSGPREAWLQIEVHQDHDPLAKMWVRQVYADVGQHSWAVVKEVQEPWPALRL